MFDFLFNPQGRISRKGIWLGFFLPYLAITLVLGFLEAIVPLLGIVSFLVGLFYFWPSMGAVPIKRLHDLGRSGWWLLAFYGVGFALLIVAAVGLFASPAGQSLLEAMSDGSFERYSEAEQAEAFMALFSDGLSGLAIAGLVLSVLFGLFQFVVFYVLPGQRADNRFGRDPLADGRGFGDSPAPPADTFA